MAKKKITIEYLIVMDCRIPDNMLKLKKAVNKTKWFERFELEDITPSTVEEGYNRIEKKYGVKVGYIQKASENSWCIMIKTKEGKWIETVYCYSLEEGMYKSILVLYGYLVKGLKFRTEDK